MDNLYYQLKGLWDKHMRDTPRQRDETIWTTEDLRKKKTLVFICPECGDINSSVSEFTKGTVETLVTSDSGSEPLHQEQDIHGTEFISSIFNDCGCESTTHPAIECAIHIVTCNNKLVRWYKHNDYGLDQRFDSNRIKQQIESFLNKNVV